MQCGRARRLLWPDKTLRVVDPALAEARAHVADCRACQAFLADMETMATLARTLAPRAVTPTSLRDRLLSSVARERSEARRRGPAVLYRARTIVAGVAALAALVLVILSPIYHDRGGDMWRDAISAIVADHARELHHEALMTSDAGVAREWLRARVAFAVHVPEVTGIVLERAEICRLNGLRACLLRYRVDGPTVSYYSYRLPAEEARRDSAESTRFREEQEAGYRVVAWEEAGVLRALVADLPADRLLALARACRAHRNRSGAAG